MRYRPLGVTGTSVSALTLALPAGALKEGEAYRLACTALEQGINSFDLADGDAAAASAIRQVVASVGRKLLVLTLHLSDDAAEDAPLRIREALHATGAGCFDIVLFDGAGLTPDLMEMAAALRRNQWTRAVGLSGDGDMLDTGLTAGGLDVLSVAYNLRSGWPERNRIKTATGLGLTIIGRDFHIDARTAAKAQGPKGLGRLFQRGAAQEAHDAYAFLRQTRGWTSEQICLAYALTEPALATVQVETTSPVLLRQFAETTERELPTGAGAQIEIARFAALRQAGAA